MAAAERALREHLGLVDLVWEVCDARCPFTSRNPRLRRLTGGKPRLLVLGKADLAPEADLAAWLAALRAAGELAVAVDAIGGRGLGALWRASGEAVAPRARSLRAMVVGIPNVGKSTLLNRIGGRRRLATGARPGVTRGPQWIETPSGRLLDLPGVLAPRLGSAAAAWRLLAIGAVDEAAVDPRVAAPALLGWVAAHAPRRLEERYGIDDTEPGDGERLLAAIAGARGMRAAGGGLDLERAAATVLAEFRRGRLGAVMLEQAP